MIQKCIACLAALCLLAMPTLAAEVDSDSVYCFTSEDFSTAEPLAGICITHLPDGSAGAVMLGQRILQPGDILTADQLSLMTFVPVRTEEDADAVMTYLPIYENRVEGSATMTIGIRGKEDKAPVAQDFTVETYKNLPNDAMLKVCDPEGQAMTYTVIRQPKRGTVEIREDGSFTYTPKKNKVGVDSFTYTATDPAGKVSREATVTIQILKPVQAAQYTDTANLDCRFEAEWLRNTGLFVGERMGDQHYFQPEKPVTGGEFLAMVMQMLEISPTQDLEYPKMAADAPQWLKPYLAAALRSGLISDMEMDYTQPITGDAAAVILQNALDLRCDEPQESYRETALAVMNENGLVLKAGESLTRADVAVILYEAYHLAQSAPGLAVFNAQQ